MKCYIPIFNKTWLYHTKQEDPTPTYIKCRFSLSIRPSGNLQSAEDVIIFPFWCIGFKHQNKCNVMERLDSEFIVRILFSSCIISNSILLTNRLTNMCKASTGFSFSKYQPSGYGDLQRQNNLLCFSFQVHAWVENDCNLVSLANLFILYFTFTHINVLLLTGEPYNYRAILFTFAHCKQLAD